MTDDDSEFKRKWASGTFSETKLVKRQGPLCLPCIRFGVGQGEDDDGRPKVRPIDDFTENFHNSCANMVDKITVSGIYGIASFVKLWSGCIWRAKQNRTWRLSVELSDGTSLVGSVHQTLRSHDQHMLLGKCFDLGSAYRQLPVRPAHAHLSIFGIQNPSAAKAELFDAHALPFGAGAAVHGFNRAAESLETILAEIFGTPCTHNFDDFTFVLPKAIANVVAGSAKEVLKLLGWSVKASKDKPNEQAFTALGVRFDLIGATVGEPQWVKELQNLMQRILGNRHLRPSEAAQLRGRLVFANSHTFGKMGAVGFNALGRRAHCHGPTTSLDANLIWALEWWATCLVDPQPRAISLANMRAPVFLFTDGACEPDDGSETGVNAAYSAVMFDPEDNTCAYFGKYIDEDLLEFLTYGGLKRQIVRHAEMIPCLVAREVWKDRLRGCAVFSYVDNEAARFALIKGGSPTQVPACVAAGFWRLDSDLRCYSWFGRVPSPSNISDGPSRGRDLGPIRLGLDVSLHPKRVGVLENWERQFLSHWVAKIRRAW